MMSVLQSASKNLIAAEETHYTLVLSNRSESDTGTSEAGDISDGDICRVGFEGDTVIASLIDKVLDGDVLGSPSVDTIGVFQPTLSVICSLLVSFASIMEGGSRRTEGL
jgi:hypothetical protein